MCSFDLFSFLLNKNVTLKRKELKMCPYFLWKVLCINLNEKYLFIL